MTTSRIKLMAFDFEGTIAINTNSSSMWESLAKEFDYEKDRDKMISAFFKGNLSYKKWADDIFDILVEKKLTQKKLEQMVKRDLVAMPGAQKLFVELKRRKIKTAVISGGIRNVFDIFASKYGIKPDYSSVANELYFDARGRMISGVCSDFDFEGKATVLGKICKREGISLKDCGYVGDYINDTHVFDAVALPIAINTNIKELRKKAKVIIDKKDISEVLSYV